MTKRENYNIKLFKLQNIVKRPKNISTL